MRFIFAAAIAALAARALLADGGTLQLQEASAGYQISVFSSPGQLRAGPADISVMVQNAKDHTTVLDAHVFVHISRLENGVIKEIVVPATRAQASNKLLYAATLKFPNAGDWRLAVDVAANGRSALVSGRLRVLAAQAPIFGYWPYFLAIPVLIALFGLNQWLRQKRTARNPRVLP